MSKENCLVTSEETSTYAIEATREIGRKVLLYEIIDNEKYHTLTLVKPSKTCKPIGVKCMYKMRRNDFGEIVKHMARLVVKVYS